MTKSKPFTPKPLILQALPAGSKNPSHAAHMNAINDAKKQLDFNNMSGGKSGTLKPATIPQSPMYGMKSSLGDANDITVGSTNQRSQIHENASYDNMVGKVANGGSRKRKSNRKKRTKRKRTKKTRKHLRKRKSSKHKRRHTRKSRRKQK